MKLPAISLIASCLATAIAGALSSAADAADDAMVQELAAPKASGKVTALFWARQVDSYTLHVRIPAFMGDTIACLRGLDPTFGNRSLTRDATPQPANSTATTAAEDMRRLGIVDVSEALRNLVPRNIGLYQPALVNVDGSAATYTALHAPKVVQVWLLRADGTLIPPVARTEDFIPLVAAGGTCEARNRILQARASARRAEVAPWTYDDEILYRFPLAESEQAVAVAIKLDDDYYVEKLQPKPAAQ